MSKRKVGALLLMSPIIVFVLSCLVLVVLSMLIPSFSDNQVLILGIVLGTVVLSVLVGRPLGIAKTVNSEGSFSIGEINRFSRAETKKNFWMFLLFIITYLAINIVLGEFLDPETKDPILSLVGGLVSLFFSIFFTLSITNVSLVVANGSKLKYSDLFNKIKYFFHFLVSYILYVLIVILGFILFIIPGIYRATRFSFYTYLIVDKKYGPIKALKESRAITKGKFRDVFSYNLILSFINLLGMLCLLVGLLWTVPMTMIAKAKMYKKLNK